MKMAVDLSFEVKLNPSFNQEGSYPVGSEVSGEVIFSTSTHETSYKRITVSLIGKAEVYFFLPTNSETNRHFRETDVFFQAESVVWERGRENPSLPIGISTYPFKFTLAPEEGKTLLPASVECKEGRIKYTIEAKLIREMENEIEASVARVKIPVTGRVDINRSDLLIPRAIQNEIAVSSGCFNGGTVSLIVSLLRSGYCVGQDKIKVVVKVESDNGKKLRSLCVSLVKRVFCYAQGQPSVTNTALVTNTNHRLPRGGVSFTWNVPAIPVPFTDCTLTNCSIIRVTYFLHATFTGRCMETQDLELPIILGNVPYRGDSMESFETTQGSSTGEYRPSLSSLTHPYYQPPVIPLLTTSSVSTRQSKVKEGSLERDTYEEDDEGYEDVRHDTPLVK